MKFKIGDRIIETSFTGKDFRVGTIFDIVTFSAEYRKDIIDAFERMGIENEAFANIADKLEDYYRIQWDNGEVSSLGHPSCYKSTRLHVEGNDILKGML